MPVIDSLYESIPGLKQDYKVDWKETTRPDWKVDWAEGDNWIYGLVPLQTFASVLTPIDGFPTASSFSITADNGTYFQAGTPETADESSCLFTVVAANLVIGQQFDVQIRFSHFSESVTELDPPEAVVTTPPRIMINGVEAEVNGVAPEVIEGGVNYPAWDPTTIQLVLDVVDFESLLGVPSAGFEIQIAHPEITGGASATLNRYAVFEIRIRPHNEPE